MDSSIQSENKMLKASRHATSLPEEIFSTPKKHIHMRGYASHILLALMVKPFYADDCPIRGGSPCFT